MFTTLCVRNKILLAAVKLQIEYICFVEKNKKSYKTIFTDLVANIQQVNLKYFLKEFNIFTYRYFVLQQSTGF